MSSLINNIGSKNNVPNNMNSQNTIQKKYENVVRQKYDEAYKGDMQKHKTGLAMLSVMTVAGLLAFALNKQERLLSGTMGFGCLSCLIISPFFKPKKEKYDNVMQKELNEVV